MSAPAAPANPFSVEALSAKALEMIGADAPTTDSILRIAAQLAQLVSKAQGMRGSEKAALVQQVLREILNTPSVRSKMDAATFDALTMVVEKVVPTTLTLIVSAGRGEFDLKKPRESFIWCCRSVASVAVAAAVAHTAPAEKGPEPADIAAPEQVEAAPAAAPAPAPDANIPPTESTEQVAAPAEAPVAPSTN